MPGRLVNYVRNNPGGVFKRAALSIAVFQFVQVALLVWCPSILHRNAFPEPAEAGYVAPKAVNCGRWPDRACREVRHEYETAWDLAQRPDFVPQLETWLAQPSFQSNGKTAAVIEWVDGFSDASDLECLQETFLSSAYTRAQGQATVSAGEGALKLVSTFPVASALAKQPAKDGSKLLDAAGALVGDNVFLSGFYGLGMLDCGP